MNINSLELNNAIEAVKQKHQTELKNKSGRSADFEGGFLYGLVYIQKYLIPAFEQEDKDTIDLLIENQECEIADLKLKHKLGLEE